MGKGGRWAEGAVAPVGGGSHMIEGAQQPFGCGRRKPSCTGPGSEEPSAVECGPNHSFLITLERVIDK